MSVFPPTCAQEEDFVASVGGRHLIDGDGGELVLHVGPDHQRPLVYRVYGVVHGGVVSHKVDHLVRVILGGFHVGGERPSGTLFSQMTRVMILITFNCLGFHSI